MAKLKFWGVQGSCPGSSTNNSFGNNTPCISIEFNETLIILDAGTGIRHLSNNLKSDNYKKILILLTHSHWDHIQGFPFFNFLHTNSEIYIYSHSNSHLQNLSNQINGINFPLNLEDISAALTFSSDLNKIQSIFNIKINEIKQITMGIALVIVLNPIHVMSAIYLITNSTMHQTLALKNLSNFAKYPIF